MSNPSKAKGTDFEVAVRDYLREVLDMPGIERLPTEGANDRGDIAGVNEWTLELKAEKTIDLAGYMTELARERENGDTMYGAAIVKRRRKGVAEAYAVMPLSMLVWLIAETMQP